MGKRQHQGSIYKQLIKAFDAVFSQYYASDEAPNITAINKILDKNIKNKDLDRFLNYIQIRIAGEFNEWITSAKTIKVLQELVEKITETQNAQHENIANHPIRTIDSSHFFSALSVTEKKIGQPLIDIETDQSKHTKVKRQVSPQYHYSVDLNNNSGLQNFIAQYGPIEFTFSDTVFVLTADSLFRHDIDKEKTAQEVAQGDYAWFKTALEIYVIKNKARKFKYEITKGEIAQLLSVEESYISNRRIIGINPLQDNKILPLLIESFVFQPSFGLSSRLERCFNQSHQAITSATLDKIIKNYINNRGVISTTPIAHHMNEILNIKKLNATGYNNSLSEIGDNSTIPIWQSPVVMVISSAVLVTAATAIFTGVYCFFKRKKPVAKINNQAVYFSCHSLNNAEGSSDRILDGLAVHTAGSPQQKLLPGGVTTFKDTARPISTAFPPPPTEDELKKLASEFSLSIR
ncbi:MAG: hypothetical protein WAL30_05350 [Candidatus Aquirickettsiella sp.]